MSKVGKKPVTLPEGVEVLLNGKDLTVKGPKGELKYTLLDGVNLKVEEKEIIVSVDSPDLSKFWGLTRALVANMVEGVSQGYEKKLHIIGVGYGAQLSGKNLVLSLGLSHKVDFPIREGIDAKVEQDPKGNAIVTLSGIDKQLVGEVAAKIKSLRKPEPYKGKGIRYFGEEIKLKPGKAAK